MKWHWTQTDEPEAAQGAFQQSWPYAIAVRACGGRIDRAVLTDGNRMLAEVQVMRRAAVAVALRGPVWAAGVDDRQRRAGLRRLARLGAAVIVLPEVGVQGLGIIPLMTPRHVALWDLRAERDALCAGLSGKWRNALTAAERQGVLARPAPHKALTGLMEAEGEQRSVRRYRALPAAFSRALPAESLRLWHWGRGNRCHAAMCFIRHGDWATYHLGYADVMARESGAHRVMLWQAALALQAEGVTVLDLGDINTEDALGLARFKLGTGAELHRLGAASLVLPL